MPSIEPLTPGERIALFALTLLGVALRLCGNDHGLPWITEPDDEAIRMALGLAHGITPPNALLEPSRYPHLLLYLMWFCDWLFIDPAAPIAEAWGAAVRVGRTLSGFLSALAIVPTFFVGRHLGGSRVGWSAAALLCFDLLSVQNGHLGKPHAPLLAFSTAALWYAVRLRATGNLRDLLLASACGALAGAMIHSGFVVFGGIAIAALLAPSAGSPVSRWLRAAASLTLAIVAAALIGYPNALHTLVRVFMGRAESAELMGPHTVGGLKSLGLAGFAEPVRTLADYFPVIGPFGLGAMLCLGVFRSRRRPAILALLVTCVLFFAVFGHRAVFASRFMLPIVPCFLIAAAAGLDVLVRLLPARFQSLTFVAVVLVVSAWPAATAVRLAYLYTQPDTRELAGDWIARNVGVEERIAATPYLDMPLLLDAESLERHQEIVLATTAWTRVQLAQSKSGQDPQAAERRSVWFPFRQLWPASPAVRAHWLQSHGIRYTLSLFDNPMQRVVPEYNAFREFGDLAFAVEPGPIGFTGAELFNIPFPLHWTWIMERSGPAIEIVRLR